jgi:acyl carrier protein
MSIAVTGIETLREWLLEKHPDLAEIDDDTDLFEQKLIDSINFVEYILIIEELLDREIPVTPDLIPKTATLARVRDNFLVAA